MNELILNTQPNVQSKLDLEKEMRKIIKETAKHYNFDRNVMYAYVDFLFSGKLEKLFARVIKTVEVLKAVDDIDLLLPHLNKLAEIGITVNIEKTNNLQDKSYMRDSLDAIVQLQNDILEDEEEIEKCSDEAELQNFCTKNKFKHLTESYYKLNHDKNPEKIREKLVKDIYKNNLNNNGMSTIIGE